MRYLQLDGVPAISRIGLGTWQFGSREWGYGDDYADTTASDILHRALDLGINLIDTAEMYGFGKSEEILGRALGDRRDEAFLATKLFPVLPVRPVVEQRGLASARRLGVHHLDLYQVHQPHPIRDTIIMRGMASLQQVGLVGEVGVSNYSLARWKAAEAALGSRVLSNQVSFSMVDRGPERELIPWAEEHGRVVIAYSPLGQGLLSGKYDAQNLPSGAVRRANPLFLPESLERAGELLATLREVADAHSATPAQVALAWTIRHPNVVAIPGASSVEQVESNAAAAEIELTDDQVAALSGAAQRFEPVSGLRAAGGMFRALLGSLRVDRRRKLG